jgi:hypothetical protein
MNPLFEYCSFAEPRMRWPTIAAVTLRISQLTIDTFVYTHLLSALDPRRENHT